MIKIEKLTKNFGGLCAVNRLSMSVEEGKIVGLIGPNGAGKTTVFNLITGFLKTSGGKIFFKEKNIASKKSHIIAEKGIVRSFQIAKLFPHFTVLQNIEAASYLFIKMRLYEAIFHTPGFYKKERNARDHAGEILSLIGMDQWKDVNAGRLSHGHQKLLGIGIALAAKPKVLLLDEPFEGMNPMEVEKAINLIYAVQARGITILLIEHNMRAMMRICNKLVVLNFGQEIATGTPEEIKVNKDVIKAYIGAGEYAN